MSTLSEYKIEIIKIGKWSLNRKKHNDPGHYLGMMIHQCGDTYGNRVQNGETGQKCVRCHDPIPDEIWATWWLLCNDQYRGFSR